MKLSRPAAGLAVAALLALSPTVALAQEPDPVLTVAPSQACGRVTLDATSTAGSYEIAVFAGPSAGDAAADPLGQFWVRSEAPAMRTFTLDEDAYAGQGFVSWTTVQGPEQDAYVRGAVAVDTNCQPADPGAETVTPEPSETPTGSPDSPEPEPAPSTEPPTEPSPSGAPQPDSAEAPAVDLDCSDFPLLDGRTAQAVLDADPSDPYRLDADSDGTPCEAGEQEDATDPAPSSSPAPPVDDDDSTGGEAPAPTAGSDTGCGDNAVRDGDGGCVPRFGDGFDQIDPQDVPSGGVETGGGPA